MNRRHILKAAAGLGVLASGAALGRYALVAPPTSAQLDSVDALAVRIYEALPQDIRERACVSYDHPLRQCHNRGLGMGGVNVTALHLDWDTRCAISDLLHAGLSPVGRLRVPYQDATRWAGVNFMQLLICGDPRKPPYQIVLSGIHLNLRLGDARAEGIAFGGPQVYGDQRGDEVAGLPGNAYRYQWQRAHRFVTTLTSAERTAVRVARAPAQVNIGLQGRNGRFDGLAIGELSASKRALAHDLVAGILDTYAEQDAAYAWQCLARNGGVDALRFADYEEDFHGSRRAGHEPSQIFRLEGPSAVFHFRGEPHVHAFINVAMDGDRPLSLGERLGENPRVLEGENLRAFFETAMCTQGEADLAYMPSSSVVGRLREGAVRNGDIWAAESWIDELVLLEARGADLSSEIAQRLRARGKSVQGGATYRIVTTGYVAHGSSSAILGRVLEPRSRGLLRDAICAHARVHGFDV